jgi:formate dehydrogenase subunit delta
MNDQDLVRMANQIADYYRAYPQEEAVAGIGAHIRSFWDPRMRAGLAAHVAAGGKGLSQLALAAGRALLAPQG